MAFSEFGLNLKKCCNTNIDFLPGLMLYWSIPKQSSWISIYRAEMLYEIIDSSLIGLARFSAWFTFTLHHLVRNLGVQVTVKSINSCLHCRNLFCFFVWNVEPEVLFHRHHQLHRVERVESQLFEGCWFIQLRLVAFGSTLEHLIDFGLHLLQEGHLGWVWWRGEVVSDRSHGEFERLEIGEFFEDGSGLE